MGVTTLIVICFVVVLLIIVELYSENKKAENELDKRLEKYFLPEEKKIDFEIIKLKTTLIPSDIPKSIKKVAISISNIQRIRSLPDDLQKKYEGGFTINMYEMVNDRIDEIAEYYKNEYLKGRISKRIAINRINSLENELIEQVLNYDLKKGMLGSYKNDVCEKSSNNKKIQS